jgi:hypothetical protein
VADPDSRSVFVGIAATLVGLHMLAVTLAAIPTNPVSDAFRPQTEYLSPFFGQSWRLFAPNPINADQTLLVQGAYVDGDGNLRKTPWVNWTKVEQDVIEHRLIGGRAGYISTKIYGALGEEFEEMENPEQKALSARTSPLAPPSWKELRDYLARIGPDEDDLADYMRYDRAAARLATEVIASRYPTRNLTAVRYALRDQGVTPFADRHGSKAERKAARPAPKMRIDGWRIPTYGPVAEQRGVADFDRRHR